MGMDVYGKAPTSEVGTYWRSNIFGWPSILDAITATGVLDPEVCTAMSFNDGAGPNAEDAIRLADALDKLVDSGQLVAPSGAAEHTRGMGESLMKALTGTGAEVIAPGAGEPFDPDTIRAFAAFSRASGGFEVC